MYISWGARLALPLFCVARFVVWCAHYHSNASSLLYDVSVWLLHSISSRVSPRGHFVTGCIVVWYRWVVNNMFYDGGLLLQHIRYDMEVAARSVAMCRRCVVKCMLCMALRLFCQLVVVTSFGIQSVTLYEFCRPVYYYYVRKLKFVSHY